jgi:hypothetical protein
MKHNYVCSVCQKKAVIKDPKRPPFLTCGCDKGAWVGDAKGGKYSNPTRARPILSHEEPEPQIEVIRLRRKSKPE